MSRTPPHTRSSGNILDWNSIQNDPLVNEVYRAYGRFKDENNLSDDKSWESWDFRDEMSRLYAFASRPASRGAFHATFGYSEHRIGRAFESQPPNANDTTKAKITNFFYKIEGQLYPAKCIHYGATQKFCSNIFDGGGMIEKERFIQETIIPFMNEKSFACDLLYKWGDGAGLQTEKLHSEFEIVKALDIRIHNVINDLFVKPRLEMRKSQMTANSLQFIKEKGIIVGNHPTSWNPGIESFYSTAGPSLKWMGFAAEPDTIVGYEGNFENSGGVISVSALGELKTPGIRIRYLFNLVQSIMRGNQKEIFLESLADRTFHPEEASQDYKNAVEFARIIIKLTTEAVHAGQTRAYLSDFIDTLFIELDKNFIFENDQIYSSCESIGAKESIRFLKCEYFWVHARDKHLRLYYSAFLAPNKNTSSEARSFQKKVACYLRKQVDQLIDDEFEAAGDTSKDSDELQETSLNRVSNPGPIAQSSNDENNPGSSVQSPVSSRTRSRTGANQNNLGLEIPINVLSQSFEENVRVFESDERSPPTKSIPPRPKTPQHLSRFRINNQGDHEIPTGNAYEYDWSFAPITSGLAHLTLSTLSINSDLLSSTDLETPTTRGRRPFRNSKQYEEQKSMSQRSFLLDKALLERESLVKLGDVLCAYKRVGDGFNSQICIVDTRKFFQFIPASNQFCIPQPSSTSLLKVFDPISRPIVENDDDYDYDGKVFEDNYPKAFCTNYEGCYHSCFKELKVYERLKGCDCVPRIQAYGRMVDVYTSVGQAYWRVVGPYILMEEITRHPYFEKTDVTLEILQQKVIPAFQKLHAKGIVHNDINFDNILFTPDLEVKIVGFEAAKSTTNKREFERELVRLVRYFTS